MPKIIENLENRLIEEARKQIEEAGYSAMTIRSVAKACGVGIGTVYNYFRSKDELLATYMLIDWNHCMDAIRESSRVSLKPEPVVLCIHNQLQQFARLHQSIFRDETASMSFAGSFSHYHGLLRQQLAEPLEKFCTSKFSAEFIAEALLTWTMAGKEFNELYGMIEKLF